MRESWKNWSGIDSTGNMTVKETRKGHLYDAKLFQVYQKQLPCLGPIGAMIVLIIRIQYMAHGFCNIYDIIYSRSIGIFSTVGDVQVNNIFLDNEMLIAIRRFNNGHLIYFHERSSEHMGPTTLSEFYLRFSG